MYTVTESTKRNDEYFDFVKELDSIKGRRLKCSGECKICSGGWLDCQLSATERG